MKKGGDDARSVRRLGDEGLRVLVIDIGGSNVKLLATGHSEPRKFSSGKDLTPPRLVAQVRSSSRGWSYDALSIGFPGTVGRAGPTSEPLNLGKGWVGFDFAAAFARPVKIANDATMQALGSYEGGRMLFLGLGTGLGATLIADRIIVPFELGQLPWRREGHTLGEALSARGRNQAGTRRWRRMVAVAASQLMKAFRVDYVVLGGGNAKKLDELPQGLRVGNNQTAFRGGFRMWSVDDIPVLTQEAMPSAPQPVEWRLL